MPLSVATASRVPLDRILWQRIEVDAHGHRTAVVAGTRHRRPATVRVSEQTAKALAADGLPTVTHARPGRPTGAAS